jgi:glycosyltransferase 2 family protein
MTAKTDTTPYKGHFKLYLTGFIVGLLVFAGSTYVAAEGELLGWEYTWFHLFNDWPESLYRTMVIITFFGSVWAAAIGVAAAFFARYYRLAGRLALSILAVYGLTAFAKHFIGRERPAGLMDDAQVRVLETAMGFPSAHAAVATVLMLTLLPYLRGLWRWIVPIAIAAVAISRLYLGVHVPLDVIGGVAVGVAVVAAIRVLPQPLRIFLRID